MYLYLYETKSTATQPRVWGGMDLGRTKKNKNCHVQYGNLIATLERGNSATEVKYSIFLNFFKTNF